MHHKPEAASLVEYELVHYILNSLPADERKETIASLIRANPEQFRLMREAINHPSPNRPWGP
jgi:hypothetical protein